MNFSSDLGVYDQPWRRATELAWWSLEHNRPVEAERLARAGLKAVRKGWAPYLHRRLGAYEVLAFALAAQGRDQEVSDLLEKWRQEQGPAGETWLATLRADLLLRAENPAAAALVVPEPEKANASTLPANSRTISSSMNSLTPCISRWTTAPGSLAFKNACMTAACSLSLAS